MPKNKKESKITGWKRSALEWLGIGAVIAILYFTGWHTVVIGTMQRALLWTGLFNPDVQEVRTTDGPMLSQRAFNYTLFKPNGEKIKLEKFKGKVLFINFWASWCPPCIAEMPTIETLYNKVKDNENIKFLLISLNQNPEKATKFMKSNNYPMPYYFPASTTPAALRSPYIPATFVVSKRGKIIYKHGGLADYSSDAFRKWLLKHANSGSG